MFRAADRDTANYLVVAKFEEICAVRKQTTQIFLMEGFDLKKLKRVNSKEQYRVEIPNMFADFENFEAKVDIDRTSETIRENIRTSAKVSRLLRIEEA
jgi:hypothetical protein